MTFKENIALYRLLSKNQHLADKRHPMLDKNRAMKVFTFIFVGFWAVYLMFFGFLFANVLKDESAEPYDIINGGFIVFLIIDFFTRFGMQETPAQIIKPYKLLPIPENFLHNAFLLKIGLSWGNLFWMFFFVPFGIMSVALAPFYTFVNFIGYMLGVWLMFVFDGYWYLFWRTLINHHTWYLLIPCAIYGALVFFGMVNADWFFDASSELLRGCITWNALSFVIIIAMILVMFFVNRIFQKKFVYMEIAKVEKIKKVKSSEISFLNRFGIVGEYLKLEIKSIIRNQIIRKSFISGLICTLMFCCLFAFTDAYDNQPFMRTFICMYCFSALGVITLTNVMGAEGNYIDGLMSRKESVLALLKAKYYFNCLMMILPLIFCIMPVIENKMTFMEALACLFFSMGVIFPFLFQLAVYNSTTIHLNEKMTKGGQNSKYQIIVSLVALFVPMGIMYLLVTLLGTNIGSFVMIAIGAVGAALHPLWLKNIYSRFMKRRYENMAGFRATR